MLLVTGEVYEHHASVPFILHASSSLEAPAEVVLCLWGEFWVRLQEGLEDFPEVGGVGCGPHEVVVVIGRQRLLGSGRVVGGVRAWGVGRRGMADLVWWHDRVPEFPKLRPRVSSHATQATQG